MDQSERSHHVSGTPYGILCGTGLSIWLLTEYALGFHTTSLEIGQYSGYFSIIIPLIFIFTALHDYQTKISRKITFIEGINIGFKIALISSFIFSLFFYVYSKYINPDWIDVLIEWQRRKLILNGAGNDQIGKFIEQNKQINNSFGQAVMELLSSIGIGVLVTIIEIPIVKKFFHPK